MLGALCPLFQSDLRLHIEAIPNIMAYVAHMKAEFYPDLADASASLH